MRVKPLGIMGSVNLRIHPRNPLNYYRSHEWDLLLGFFRPVIFPVGGQQPVAFLLFGQFLNPLFCFTIFFWFGFVIPNLLRRLRTSAKRLSFIFVVLSSNPVKYDIEAIPWSKLQKRTNMWNRGTRKEMWALPLPKSGKD
ncbi:hypothetical protein SAMN04488057_101482 [Cyclobacterium lianum]|uniref:Uncharacterized protein n=1 Tax=Cyclobacterium lianum TaxID=388280 RepID=A0A1M7IVI7_9BACT|nr:hypothetical protein SAMN04488057_101482 [Cyclobacterium lianum]